MGIELRCNKGKSHCHIHAIPCHSFHYMSLHSYTHIPMPLPYQIPFLLFPCHTVAISPPSSWHASCYANTHGQLLPPSAIFASLLGNKCTGTILAMQFEQFKAGSFGLARLVLCIMTSWDGPSEANQPTKPNQHETHIS
jgi:hypothetical protein